MCITIDDLPMVTYGIEGHDSLITESILSALKKHNAPAIGYVNEGKLYRRYYNGKLNPAKVKLLERWLEEGMELGNHTYSHANYHQTSFADFSRAIIKGEKVIKELAAQHDTSIRFFRHPYLRMGETKERTDSLNSFLAEHNYTPAPVTIDNEEYIFAQAYAKAFKKGNQALADSVGQAYLSYMDEQLSYFEKASDDLLGRNMKHTLLIHANYLNATHLDQLLSIYEDRGYSFISQEEVLEDPAYQLPITKFDDWGISWIQWWGMSKGLKGDFFKGEAVTPDFVIELAAS